MRCAEPDDAVVLGALQLRWDLERGGVRQVGFIGRYADTWLACRDTRPAWVAKTADGNPVGFVLAAHITKMPSLLRPQNAWLHLSAVYVDADLRGQGIGTLLLRSTMDWAHAHDVERIQLNADDAARGLYERVGFGQPSDRLMQVLLTAPSEVELRLF